MSDLFQQLSAALAHRYRLERELGRGGMATVFLAEDLKHRNRVAIKVLDPELTALLGPERFLREIEIAARLQHPLIIPLLDSGEAQGHLYYVMPYVGGESLRQRLERERQLPVEEALRLTREVADALEFAHRAGVIHRDIKPENILLQAGHAVVADFGIARAVGAAGGPRLTTERTRVGTPAYMSPEQVMGRPDLDGRSDLYSLGCVLYEMLAGTPPFVGPGAENQHLSVTPRAVTELRPSVPGAVSEALQRVLAKTAADRFGTAAELGAALDPREPVPTPVPVPPPTPPPRWGWLLAGLAGAALVVTAVILWPKGRDRQPPAPVAPAHARTEIAVLPLDNLTIEGPDTLFARGLHDELLTQLSKVTALKVISRTSVMGYQGTSKQLKTIASELGVGSVVEGSVQVMGKRLRVNVQLIDASTDEHLWSERYDRTLDDAFAIQSEVAQAIVAAVGAALTGAERLNLTTTPTGNADAYRLYLQGMEYLVRPGVEKENVVSAQRLFERALALDPNFAIAHASLSRAHAFMYWFRHDSSAPRLARARAEAEVALRLGPDLPEAHWAIGWAEYVSTLGLTKGTRRMVQRAADEFAIALKGLPGDAELWRFSGVAHRRLGNWTEVLAAFERSTQLDPRNANTYYFLGGHTYRYLRRYPEAIRDYERALSLAPDLPQRALDIGLVYIKWQGQLDTLRAILGRLPRDARYGGGTGSVAGHRADLFLYERAADSLLQMPEMALPNLAGTDEALEPSALFAARAHQLRGDQAAARAAFDSARVRLDSWLREHPDDWPAHSRRGLALAGLGRRSEALREARWLEQTGIYREDANFGPYVATGRAEILAQAGEAGAAIDELERLLARPSDQSVHTLRLDPIWDPIREDPRFKALMNKYGPAMR